MVRSGPICDCVSGMTGEDCDSGSSSDACCVCADQRYPWIARHSGMGAERG